jgi:hypothetical protein
MADFYAFIAPSELQSQNDPVRLLKTAGTQADLLADATYDPDAGGGFWARSKIAAAEDTVDVVNPKTGEAEPAAVCGVEH